MSGSCRCWLADENSLVGANDDDVTAAVADGTRRERCSRRWDVPRVGAGPTTLNDSMKGNNGDDRDDDHRVASDTITARRGRREEARRRIIMVRGLA